MFASLTKCLHFQKISKFVKLNIFKFEKTFKFKEMFAFSKSVSKVGKYVCGLISNWPWRHATFVRPSVLFEVYSHGYQHRQQGFPLLEVTRVVSHCYGHACGVFSSESWCPDHDACSLPLPLPLANKWTFAKGEGLFVWLEKNLTELVHGRKELIYCSRCGFEGHHSWFFHNNGWSGYLKSHHQDGDYGITP